MSGNGLELVKLDYNAPELPKSVRRTQPLLFRDGDSFCCVLGPDPQAGIFGCGQTVEAALVDFDSSYRKLLDHPRPGDEVSDYIQSVK